jgi:glycosyltransferase involved in cell wall biosynthesis
VSKCPKISIITPSYNQGDYIKQTIESVLGQGYPNLEYIIIDGGSNDNTLKIIRRYEKYLHYLVSERDNGQSDAINKGFARATGDVINWLNSDDYYYPGALSHVGEMFRDISINVYSGRSRVFSESHEYLSTGIDIYPTNLEKTIGWARIDQPETFFRKSVWDLLGPLDQRFHFVMDREFWIHYLLVYGLDGILKDDELLVNFRHHDGSKTISQKQSFVLETYTLFASLAANYGREEFAAIYRDIFYAGTFPDLRPVKPQSGINWDSIFTYQLFSELRRAYAGSDYAKVALIATHINSNYLESVDYQELKHLLFRVKWLPVWIKRFYNKLQRS